MQKNWRVWDEKEFKTLRVLPWTYFYTDVSAHSGCHCIFF